LDLDQDDAGGAGDVHARDRDGVTVERDGGGALVSAGDGNHVGVTARYPPPAAVRLSRCRRHRFASARQCRSCWGVYVSRTSSAATVAGLAAASSASISYARVYTYAVCAAAFSYAAVASVRRAVRVASRSSNQSGSRRPAGRLNVSMVRANGSPPHLAFRRGCLGFSTGADRSVGAGGSVGSSRPSAFTTR